MMRRVLIGLLLAVCALALGAQTTVKGYYRRDGKYVHGYVRKPTASRRPTTRKSATRRYKSSGIGHITKGYRKKDGTYVPPHYTTRGGIPRPKAAPLPAVPIPTVQTPRGLDIPSSSPSIGTMVYVTRTGHVYHRDGCRSLRRSTGVRTMTAAEAREQGYRPCLICNP